MERRKVRHEMVKRETSNVRRKKQIGILTRDLRSEIANLLSSIN